MQLDESEPNPWAASLICTQLTPVSSERKYPVCVPKDAAANRAGYPPALACAPRAMLHASVGPETCVKLPPEFVVWKIPASEEIQTSPVTPGLTTTLNGAVVAPSALGNVKVFPPSTEM